MILPSQLLVPTTEEAGYFETDPTMFANWLAHELGDEWRVREIAGDSVHQLAGMLSSRERQGRYLLMPAGDWTVLLTDGPLGTDVGVLPLRAARDLHIRAVRATAGHPGPNRLGGTILEVHDPAAVDDPYLCRRSIYTVDNGDGTWEFGQTGKPFEFEAPSGHQRAQIPLRFGPKLLEQYLLSLDVPVNGPIDPTRAILVERAGSVAKGPRHRWRKWLP